ncbi:hypothetical protein ACLK1T_16185 [Escherichia coli]
MSFTCAVGVSKYPVERMVTLEHLRELSSKLNSRIFQPRSYLIHY